MEIRTMVKGGLTLFCVRDVGAYVGYNRLTSLNSAAPLTNGVKTTCRYGLCGPRMAFVDGERLRELCLFLPNKRGMEAVNRRIVEVANQSQHTIEETAPGLEASEEAMLNFAKAAMSSQSEHSITTLNIISRQMGYHSTAKAMREMLKEMGYLRKVNDKWMPTNEALRQGLLAARCTIVNTGKTTTAHYSAKVTAKGMVILPERLIKREAECHD